MKKKILILIAGVLVFSFLGVVLLSQKAPGMLKSALEGALNKKVVIRSIQYNFPGFFELTGFEIQENEPFAGETAFYADQIVLEVSGWSLFQRKLIVDKIAVENATIVFRKYRDKLIHSLSDAIQKSHAGSGAVSGAAGPGRSAAAPLPLEIRDFSIQNGHFRFEDYDVQPGGFVTVVDSIRGSIRNISVPFRASRTTYEVAARLLQGRGERPAEMSFSGWTEFASKDTDAHWALSGLSLPYFRPYYSQVTLATIDNGYAQARANLRIDHKELMLNMDLEILNLFFQSYEYGNQLFGLRAEEILSFLRDRSGRLKFQITARWNIADKSIKAKDVIRKSIEHSLKNTVLGNVSNILENTLQKIGEGGLENSKDDVQETIKKFKDLLKY
ncbi:MAG: DUF748 domain-containing protein [Candidatus Omnitrophica bacterium]|nr:DUF748 domain-containing protein [Candidatus Omnitrophota bacterium]